MYKVVALTKFKPELALEEARRYWAEDHGSLALTVPGIRGYLQDHWIEDLDGGEDLPFHGNSEIWYDDEAGYEATMASQEWQVLVDDGPNVFDYSTIVSGIVDEHVLLPGARNSGAVKTMWTVRLQEGLDPEEARRRWLVEHGPLVLAVPGVVRYEQNHAAKSADLEGLTEESRAFEGRLDGFFSIWFASEDKLQQALESEEWVRATRAASSFAAPAGVRGVRIAEHVKK
jgi:uncharacterized protein (TIGR02118 family)